MRSHLLIVTHIVGPRCRCFERAVAGVDGLAPTDTHTFVGPLAREQYRMNDVDPRCSTELRDEVLDLAGMVGSLTHDVVRTSHRPGRVR